MPKIIFLDIDGTLVDYETKMPLSAKTAVDTARNNGHKVYLCTGCSKAEVLQRNLCETDGMICGNGTYVEDHGTVVLKNGLSKEDTRRIVDWCNSRQTGFYLESNAGLFCNKYMKQQGVETMIKYSLGKENNLTKATFLPKQP
mgnify:CR=1 FL=1